MSWGTSYKQEINIYGEYYSKKGELEHEIKMLEKSINNHKLELFGMICGTPKDIVFNEDTEGNKYEAADIVNLLQFRYDGVIELLEDDMNRLYRLQGLLENWDSKNEW